MADDTTDDTSSDVSDGGDCDVSDGQLDICWDSTHYATCSDGKWIVRACAAGTVCTDDGNGVTCSWGDTE